MSNTNLQVELKQALEKGMSYENYKLLVSSLLKTGKSTGHTQNEDYLNYSKLSERRMKRWDKTFKLNEESKSFLEHWSKPVTFLVIAEGWCGDAAHALPVLNSITTHSSIELKIVLRDDNDELMQNFLTNGGKSIPKLIALNENNEVLFTWGPRPNEATEVVNNYKKQHGELTSEFKEDLQKWYNKNKGQSTVEDIIAELKNI